MENLAPHIVASLARQLRQLATSPPDGVTFTPGEALHEIYADIQGPATTPYEGGVFRVKLCLTKEYPAAPPKGYFLTKIFHPNVSATGDICVNTLKKDWTPDTTLSHVLAVIRCLLIVPFPESSLNDDAGKMFMESYEEYCKKAKLVTSIHAMPGKVTTACGAGDDTSSSTIEPAKSTTAAVEATVAGAGEAATEAESATLTAGSEPIKATMATNIALSTETGKPKAVDAAATKKKASLKRL